VIVETDGAARGNPGPAGIGVVVSGRDGEVLATIAEGIGEATNNVAEYTAAIEGLRRARELGATDVLLRSDSRLLIEQLAGRFKVKNERLKRLHRLATDLAREFTRITYEHLPRERNKRADALANEGVDEWLAAGRPPTHPLAPDLFDS
jgi:ribonuclease H / adenosylcobalamin/alpha-ribazole phosphatase